MLSNLSALVGHPPRTNIHLQQLGNPEQHLQWRLHIIRMPTRYGGVVATDLLGRLGGGAVFFFARTAVELGHLGGFIRINETEKSGWMFEYVVRKHLL